MRSYELTPVELHLADSSVTRHVMLRPNRNGELPVVLLNPLDDSGRVATGMWLNRDAQETVYHWTKRTSHGRYWRNVMSAR